MSPAERQQAWQVLHSRCQAIADRWYHAIAQTSFTPSGAQVRQHLGEWVEQAITLLLAEPFERDQARAIGSSLVSLHCIQPDVLGKTLEVLAHRLTEGLSAGQAVALQPRLCMLLGELATGFLQQARATILVEQEQLRDALTTELKSTEKALRKAHDQLEIRVRERTAALAAANQELRIEVAERERAQVDRERLLVSEHEQRLQAETLRQVSGVLSTSLDLEQVLQLILKQLAKVVSYDSASVMLMSDETLETVAHRNLRSKDKPLTPLPIHLLPHMQKALASHLPVIISDTSTDPRWFHRPGSEHIRCWLGIPLVVQDRAIGLLNLNKEQPGFYDQRNAELTRAFANQAAIAIHNARLYRETAKRLRETETLSAVTTALTRSLDLYQVLQSIVDSATRLISASTNSVIHLADRATGKLIPWATSAPGTNIEEKLEMSIGKGIAGLVVQEKRSINVPDVNQDSRFLPTDVASPKKSLLTVPLMIDDTCIGTLSLNGKQVNAFSADDERLLTILASQAAVAVRNARLYEAVQQELTERERAEEALAHSLRERLAAEESLRRRNRELALLNRASRTFSSTLDLDRVLAIALQEVSHLLGVVACSIWLVDPHTGELICQQTTDPQSDILRGWRLAPGEGLAGWSARNGESLIVPDAQVDERYFRGVELRIGLELHSILTVPLRVKEDVIGVFEVVDTEVNRFKPADLTLLESLAATVAIAIENARLYEQVWQNAETRAVLLREINHRVKNNLTAIIGLLYAERRHAAVKDQPAYQAIMTDLINRVQGLATVHSMLSASEWRPLLLSELTAQVIHSSLQALPRHKHVSVSVDVTPSPIRVTPDQAHNLALVINELATNTVKYALSERNTAHITVHIRLDYDVSADDAPKKDRVLFEFRDDGPGYPGEVLRLERHNVGLDLIQNIVRDGLHGELHLYNDRGAVTVIQFQAGVTINRENKK